MLKEVAKSYLGLVSVSVLLLVHLSYITLAQKFDKDTRPSVAYTATALNALGSALLLMSVFSCITTAYFLDELPGDEVDVRATFNLLVLGFVLCTVALTMRLSATVFDTTESRLYIGFHLLPIFVGGFLIFMRARSVARR